MGFGVCSYKTPMWALEFGVLRLWFEFGDRSLYLGAFGILGLKFGVLDLGYLYLQGQSIGLVLIFRILASGELPSAGKHTKMYASISEN